MASENQPMPVNYVAPLFAGALAGISVDLPLYPLDTLKTRLQSELGFKKAGGFRGVYTGLATVASTSMPTTALFFASYEATKNVFQPLVLPQYAPLVHMFAASVGEVLACVIRVPTEIAKQRKQTYVGSRTLSAISILLAAYKADGFRNGLYRGFLSTVARDVPFSLIQFPIWELLKTMVRERNNGEITGLQSGICGCIAGGLTAALTTPLDLAKTRIMLAEEYAETRKLRIMPVLTTIYLESGIRGLYAGLLPRIAGFTLGGFVYFGVYDYSKSLFENHLNRPGALAGISVDLTLYPLDTLKTRLQSEQGFQKAGGFQGVYKGLATVASTSMPSTALFFVSYEATKNVFQPLVLPQYAPLVHMFAASVGEVLACVIRVPTEIAKQRKQTYVGSRKLSAISILLAAYKADGFRNGLYRGFFSTVARDIPFSLIELPIWEMMKTMVKERNNGEITGLQSAICGCIAGGFTAAVTTPLDLAKTRIMLAEEYAETRKLRIKPVLTSIYLESGIRGLYAGLLPRMTGFTLGGFVYFGVYDYSKRLFENRLNR